ncbi:hypothetical protein ACHHYP_20412 [Achlya hypogyna]|uniref:Uncharacterized protein n=1 Tax=Achlya hypogyna TaxID=1202772 RepID=A0A1V9YNL3_ACHHY|nr:hypothetical protein ACHHYP_20412 [Achlya hypogyna]
MSDVTSSDDSEAVAALADFLTQNEDETVAASKLVDSLLLEDAPLPYVRRRQKDELVRLRAEAEQLSSHLAVLMKMKSLEADNSSGQWEKIARSQKLAAQRGQTENFRLKRALEDQLQLAEALNKLLVKRPRLAGTPVMDIEDWRLRRLPADTTSRHTTFHELMDDAYDNIETLLVRSGILDAPTGHRALTVAEERDSIVISVQSVAELNAHYLACSDKIWAIWSGAAGPALPSARYELLESFGPDGVYFRVVISIDEHGPCIYMLYAVKRYVETNRVVFVLKTVLDDERYPPPEHMLVGNHTASIIVEAMGPKQTCRRLCVSGKLPSFPPEKSPLRESQMCITEVVLKVIRPVFDALESQLSYDAALLTLLPPATEDELDAEIMQCFMDNLIGKEPVARSRVRKRQKDELVYLRAQVALLSLELAHLKKGNTEKLQQNNMRWAKVAHHQKIAAQRATKENARLKRSIEDQLQLASELDRLLMKRPRLAVRPTYCSYLKGGIKVLPTGVISDWKMRRLPSSPADRDTAFHAMMDNAFDNVETLFLRTRILDAAPGHRCLRVAEVNEAIEISVQSVAAISTEYLAAGSTVWSVWTSIAKLHLPSATFEAFGSDAVYFCATADAAERGPCLRVLYAIKRFVQAERIFFVLQTVLDDELHPVPQGLLVGNHSAGIVVEATGPRQSCRRLVMVGKLPAQLPQNSPLEGIETTISEDAASGAAIIDSILADFASPDLPPRPPRVDRQKEELAYLRLQVDQLNAHLASLTNARMVENLTSCNMWQKLARDQKMASTKANQENHRLKRALEDQLHVAKELERLLSKRPRLAELPTLDLSDWKMRRLPSEPIGRARAFHGLVDDAYANIETLFLRTRILDAPLGQRLLNVVEEQDAILISVQNVIEISKDYLTCGDKIWAIWNGCTGQLPHVCIEVLQTFGSNGVYVRITTSLEKSVPCMMLNYAIKRYTQDNCVVFVLKTVLEDERLPTPPGLLVGNHNACIVMQNVGTKQTCRRVCVEGKLASVPPQNSPLLQEVSVTDAVFKMMRPVFQTLEMLLA